MTHYKDKVVQHYLPKGGQGFNVDAISTAQDNFKEGFNFGQGL
jgi:hypothetical protein